MASTADSQVEFRRRQHAKDPQQHNAGVGAEHASFVSSGARPASTFVAPMMTQPTSFHEKNNANEQNDAISFERLSRSSHRGRHPTSYGAGAGGEEVPNEATAVFLLRGRPGSTGGTTVLPALRDSSRAARGTNQRQSPARTNIWSSEVVAGGHPLNNGAEGSSNNNTLTLSGDDASGSWNSLGHRRAHSAPNIMEGITTGGKPSCVRPSSGWRSARIPWLSADVLSPDLRDHAIPEGRRFEALEPPLQPDVSQAPGRPRSWRVRTPAPPWGAGVTPSGSDFASKDLNNLELFPKLRASYFVDVRSQEGETSTTGKVGSMMSQSSAIAGMAKDTRPFEEIKRMRLSQALDKGPQDGSTVLGALPSPAYAPSNRCHFDTSRLTPRFSPGKGIPGFASTIKCRPAYGGMGFRDGGFALQPLSPALTEPPTPPPRLDWHAHETDSQASAATDSGNAHARGSPEPEQGVLPMAQRPPDEVNAVQALMSVGRGTRASSEALQAPTPTSAPDQMTNCFTRHAGNGNVMGLSITSIPASAVCQMPEAAHTPVPSLERLKPFDVVDDDDDGLDKNLWVVVEKGSLCSSADCVYRDSALRIASRRHYHSKCTHTHNGGVKKGMVFHHHQLEKVQKHQRSHKREATKSAPYKRTTPEDHQAMEGAGVEGYRPDDWDPEETRQLDELVNQLVAPVTHAWPSIARFFPTKSSIQCLLHWRFTLNDNGIIRGNGTWGAEEDARLRKLAPVFSSPATGPRWAKIAEVMPGRTAKQCRERYNNHVDPAIKKDKIWTAEEDSLVMQLHAEHHNQFAKIARCIPGRCYDDVKNRFNLLVKRRQLAGKPGSSNFASTSTVMKASRPATEQPMAIEERQTFTRHPAMPMLPRGGTAGLSFASSDPTRSSQLSAQSGVKRSTPEMLGGDERLR